MSSTDGVIVVMMVGVCGGGGTMVLVMDVVIVLVIVIAVVLVMDTGIGCDDGRLVAAVLVIDRIDMVIVGAIDM